MIKDEIMQNFSYPYNLEQLAILINLQYLKTINDIENTETKKRKLKEKWLIEWSKQIKYNFSRLAKKEVIKINFLSLEELINKIENTSFNNNIWLKWVLLDLMIFEPYFPLNMDIDKKGNKSPCKEFNKVRIVSLDKSDKYLDSIFVRVLANYKTGDLNRYRKYYLKVTHELNEVIKKYLIALGIIIPTQLPFIWAFFSIFCSVGVTLGTEICAWAGIFAGNSLVSMKNNNILQSAKLLVAIKEIYLMEEHDLDFAKGVYEFYIQKFDDNEKNIYSLKEREKILGLKKRKELCKEIKELKEQNKIIKIIKKILARDIEQYEKSCLLMN